MSAGGGCGCGCGCGGATRVGTCGCCEGTGATTPRPLANRPRLDAIAYRVGTHGTFLATMRAALSESGVPELHKLAARTGDDASIALLDGWATVGDVLTFYQERIANEGFLRTATERRSILEAARLVGYELRPGVAASVCLAYTLDRDLTGKHTVATIPRGSRAQSVPGPEELPQTFETSTDFVASSAWNDLKPRAWRPMRIVPAQAEALEVLYLEGVDSNLKPGDVILLLFGVEARTRIPLYVESVTPEQIVPDPPGPPLSRTVVAFQRPVQDTVAAALSSLRAALAEEGGARDLELAGLGQSAIASKTVTTVLTPLDEVLSADPPADDVVAAGRSAVAALQARRAIAGARGYERVADWLGTTIAALEFPLGRLAARRRALPTAVSAVNGGFASAASIAGSAVVGLGGLLAALRLRPSAQPGDSRDLARSEAGLFGPGSDLAPRLLQALDPDLTDSLYAAWAGTALTPPPALRSAQAMRVKAAPFGATAPLRPVLDAKGAVVGSEEWPLAGSVRLGLLLVPESRVELTAATDRETSSAEHPFAGEGTQSVQLRPGKADVKRLGRGVEVKFGGRLLALRVRIRSSPGDGAGFDIRLSGDSRVYRPRLGEVLHHISDGRRVTVALTERSGFEGSEQVVTVTVEVLVPPAPLNVLTLDGQYDQIVRGSWVVVDWGNSDRRVVRRVTRVRTVAVTAYGLSARVTQLRLWDSWLTADDLLLSSIRDATVYAQSEPLQLAQEPVDDDVLGSTIELGALYDGLESGRWLIVEGERTDVPGTTGVRAAELAMLAGVRQAADPNRPGDAVHTTLLLARPLAFSYRRPTVKVWGNVVKATHGETKLEILGSGDARQPNQEFPLAQKPLTHLASASVFGAESTLEVRVDSVRWKRVDSLASLGPDARAYVVRTDETDRSTVVFGDGTRGARVPTGVENVRGEYRVGVGRPGNVKAKQISQLQSRPLGVAGVVNPLAAIGGADRDTLDQARRNAPLGVKEFDRLVSIVDYEDFARGRAGIGKASARGLSDGTRRVVHLTIAGADDIPIDEFSDLYRELRRSLSDFGDPSQPVEVAVRELVLLVCGAAVGVDPDYRWADIEPKVRAKLLEQFGFDRRELGQDVFLSEVQSAAQSVRGVVSVDVDVLAAVPETITPAELVVIGQRLSQPPTPRIAVSSARYETLTHTVAAGETLTEVAAAFGVGFGELLQLNPTLSIDDLDQLDGTVLVVRKGIRPAQLALLTPDVPDALILREAKR
jgi:predicted phage baseplate assembly protein